MVGGDAVSERGETVSIFDVVDLRQMLLHLLEEGGVVDVV